MGELRKQFKEQTGNNCATTIKGEPVPTWSYVTWLESRTPANEAVELLRKIDESGHPLGRLNQEIEAFLQATPAKPVPRTSYHWLEVAASRIKAGEPESEVMADYGYEKAIQPAKCPIEESGTISEKDWDNLETKLRQQPKGE